MPGTKTDSKYKGIEITFKKGGVSETLKSTGSTSSNIFKYEKTTKKNGNTTTIEVFPNASIDSVSYRFAMYEPEHYVAQINIEGTPSFNDIRKGIVGATATVSLIGETAADNKSLSTMLFVYSVTPKTTNEDKTKAILEIYSLDKLLDIQKFSHAYTGMTLSKILSNEVELFDSPKYGLSVVTAPRLLSYKIDDADHEIIQPYTVQYNETFRSMINRVANRCGEYLYWNGTALQYGLEVPEKGNVTLKQSEIKEITGSTQECDDFKAFVVKSAHRNGATGKNYIDIGNNDKGKSYDNEVGTPEFSQPVGRVVGPRYFYDVRPMGAVYGVKYYSDEKDDHTLGAIDHEKSDPRRFIVSSLLGKFVNNSGSVLDYFADLLPDALVSGPLGQLAAMKQSDIEKKKLNHRPLEETDCYPNFNEAEQTSYDAKPALDGDKAECYEKISHFSTCGQSDKQASSKKFNAKEFIDSLNVLGDKFYTSIHQKGIQAKENSLDIVLKASAEPKELGQIVIFNNTEYVVTEVNGDVISQTNSTDSHISLHIVPVTKTATSSYYLPEPLEQQFRHIDGNSTAYITDVKDPYGQERVRVRFSWQEDFPVQLNSTEMNNCHKDSLNEVYTAFSDDNKQTQYEADLADNTFTAYCDCVMQHLKDESEQDKPKKKDDGKISKDDNGNIQYEVLKAGHYDENKTDYVVNIYKVSITTKEKDGSTKTDVKYYSYFAYLQVKNNLTKDDKVEVETCMYKDLKDGKAQDHLVYVVEQNSKLYPDTTSTKFITKFNNLNAQLSDVENEINKLEEKKGSKYDSLKNLEEHLKAEIEAAKYKVVYSKYTEIYAPHKRISDYKDKYNEKIKKAKKDKKAKQERIDSTPWIRMASPMAGKKNTFIMKPTEETEVIVGFENGNIERPYVLGSLFSPGICSLSTRIAGKNSAGEYVPASNGDYKIIGENGAGITITDENIKMDEIFSMAGFPIIKTVTSSLPSSLFNTNLTKDADEYPMGGKVRLHDKYGFYDLTMSSKERKVSISSPLGNISLSAFQGISISAPNGDITINGKNITLKAGDKLTLISGTNKDISFKQNDWMGFLGKLLAKMALGAATSVIGKKAIDLSNIRSVWEVVFRPLNGTMSLTSNRHMLIQAGKGKAELPIETMKAKDPASVVQVFPNYPIYLIKNLVDNVFSNFDKNLATLQKAYNNIVDVIASARNNIDECDTIERPAASIAYVCGLLKLDHKRLSQAKTEQILKECIVKDNNNNKWKLTDDEAVINKFCPYLEICSESIFNQWKSMVKDAAQKAAVFANAYESMTTEYQTNKKSPTYLAARTICDAIKNAAMSKHCKTWKKFDVEGFNIYTALINAFDNKKLVIRYKLNPDARPTPLEFKDIIGKSADVKKISAAEIKSSFENPKRYAYYIILKALHQAEIIIHIKESEEVIHSNDTYKTSDFPEWENNRNLPAGYDNWDKFMQHCVPTGSIKVDNGWKSMINDSIWDTFHSAVDNWIDWGNINWITSQERSLWDTTSHAGMILFSDEKGTQTYRFDKGKVESTDNTSLNGLLNSMSTFERVTFDKPTLSKKYTNLSKVKMFNDPIAEAAAAAQGQNNRGGGQGGA